jgi:hypothetical protein
VTDQARPEPCLVFDVVDKVPHHFRLPPGPPDLALLATAGLASLGASGSAQFSRSELRYVLQRFVPRSAKVVVVDLREEAHGFVDSTPISWHVPRDWLNLGQTREWVLADETRRLTELAQQTSVTVCSTLDLGDGERAATESPIVLPIKSVQTEEELITRDFGLRYERFTVTDHRAPRVETVHRFLDLVRQLDEAAEPSWLHFHCHGGDGRTTTFLVMYDSLRNAHQVGFDEIVRRQALIGPYDLAAIKPGWKKPWAEERLRFARRFYDYVREGGARRGEDFGAWYTPAAIGPD